MWKKYGLLPNWTSSEGNIFGHFLRKSFFRKRWFYEILAPRKTAQDSLVKGQGNHSYLIDILSDRSNKVGHKSYIQEWNPKTKESMVFTHVLLLNTGSVCTNTYKQPTKFLINYPILYTYMYRFFFHVFYLYKNMSHRNRYIPSWMWEIYGFTCWRYIYVIKFEPKHIKIRCEYYIN